MGKTTTAARNRRATPTTSKGDARKKASGKSRSKSRSKKSTSSGSSARLDRWAVRLAWARDPRTAQILGVVLVSCGAFATVACASGIFSGASDLRLIQTAAEAGAVADALTASQFANILGAWGAWTAHAFMYRSFGIAGLGFGLLAAGWGVRLVAPTRNIRTARLLRNVLAAALLLPWTWGFLTHAIDPATGLARITGNDHLIGAVGLWLTQWGRFTLGWAGSALAITSGLLIWALMHPRVSAMLSSFFEKSDLSQAKDESDAATQDSDSSQDSNRPLESEKVEVELQIDNPSYVGGALETEGDDVVVSEGHIGDEDDAAVDRALAEIMSGRAVHDEEPETEGQSENESENEPQTEAVPEAENEDQGVSLEVEVTAEEEILSEDEIDSRVAKFGEYDPKLDLSQFELPGIDLLVDYGIGSVEVNPEELEANKRRIEETLSHYKISIASIKATIGPTVTLYELVPAPGVRISKIKNLEDDIALNLAALGIRIIAPIPGRGTIGIEVPNSKPDIVSMRSLISSNKFQNNDMALPIALGKTISNETYVFDLTKMPHVLMAGATGQGKSVGLNAMLVSLLYKKHPSQLKFVLVDPKKVELTLFNHIERHYLAKLPETEEAIITDNDQVVRTLKSLCIEMDQRYELLKNAHCRNLAEYNAKFIRRKLNPEEGHKYLPYIVLVIDEFADLIMTAGKEVEQPIARLAQLARAIGIHLIIATQRPSVNIITGTIKANFPCRIAFRVTSKVDSRTILDAGGADQLIGRGDMLLSTGNDLIRLQCGFVDTPEVEAITDYIGSQRGYASALLLPEVPDEKSEMASIADEERDVLFEDAARVIVMHQQGSTSLLQRKLKLGYNRAGRLVDQLEAAGIIGPFEGSKARKVLIPDELSLEQLLSRERDDSAGGHSDPFTPPF
jgi:S-DNA-T family DNA segregation ATPase FtsK/SpoIIIE